MCCFFLVFLDMDDEKKEYIEQLKKHKENARSVVLYAMQRIDLLLISISGAGIYVCLEALKFSMEKSIVNNLWLFKLSGSIFVLAIIANIYSQWLSYKSNFYDMSLTSELICEKEHNIERTSEIDELSFRKEKANNLLSKANSASILLMIGGLVILISALFVIF